MASGKLSKAVLIPLDADNRDAPEEQWIRVQFNPATLRVTLSNTLRDSNSGGGQSQAAQFINKSESTLTVELVFDTTVAQPEDLAMSDGTQTLLHDDVRRQTQKIAGEFMQPQDAGSERPRAPKRCRFQWGSFSFIGLLGSYSETLDFFSPEGVPLRATLALTFKQDSYQFDIVDIRDALRRQGRLADGGNANGAAAANQTAGRDPKQWRDTALYNGLENPRFGAEQGVVMPPSPSSSEGGQGAGGGYSYGESARLGTRIPGAF